MVRFAIAVADSPFGDGMTAGGGKAKSPAERGSTNVENAAGVFACGGRATLKTWGKLYAMHEAKGFNMDVMDSLIAASALVHQLTVVTRNTSDFSTDVKTVNPWIV